MQKYLLTLSFLLSAWFATGQGWQRVYGGGGADGLNAIAQTPDGGYVLAGYYGLTRGLLIKVDAEGNEQWNKKYTGTGAIQAKAIVATRDSGLVVAGYIDNGTRNIYLFKTNAYGDTIWAKSFGNVNLDEEAYSLIELPDGSLVMTGYRKNLNNDVLVLKTNAVGQQLWLKTYGQSQLQEIGRGIALAANGDLLIAGEIAETVLDRDVYVLRIDQATGDTIWTQRYPYITAISNAAYGIASVNSDEFVLSGFTKIGGFLMKIAGDGNPAPIWQKIIPQAEDLNGGVAIAANGDIYSTGNIEISPAVSNLYVVRATADGDVIWEANAGRGVFQSGYGIVAAKDGGAAVAGELYQSLGGSETKGYMVKTDGNGLIYTSYLQANIFRDDNSNCLPDNGEPGLRNWIAIIANQFDTVYAVANGNGDFQILVDTGLYTVKLFQPNTYWQPCTPFTTVAIPDPYSTVSVQIPVRSQLNCPHNEVDIATPILRRCTDNIYTVRYCNSGTSPSDNTTIQVILDPALSVTASSIPYTQQQDTLIFDVGTIDNGECQTFTFTAFLDCDNTVTKQTHCVTAHIYPDAFCDPGALWDGAIIEAKARCDGDMVNMYLVNRGAAMDIGNFTQFVIAEDVLMLTAPDDPNYRVTLTNVGLDSLVWSHEATGKTYRIFATQTPGYPGISIPTAAIEGCISDTSSNNISYEFYTMFPEDDADAFVSVHCQESEESTYQPTYLKRGHPKGYDVAHYVSPKTDLDFLIQFKNVGADTVQLVTIRDTLAAELDPATVYPGASSHPYEFQVYGNGIVEFTLPNINLLPGSSASEGYVKFRVSQKPNLPCETVILNSAAIYFDFNAPAISNQTFHTVCEDSVFLILGARNIQWTGADLRIYPNPFNESAQFEVRGVNATTYGLTLYDIQGRLLFNSFYSQPNFRLLRHQLPAGLIFYRLTADGKPVATGKLIAK